MSAELLEDVTDEIGNDIRLVMLANCYAYLIIADKHYNHARFQLSPNERCINNVKIIISALQSWIQKCGE